MCNSVVHTSKIQIITNYSNNSSPIWTIHSGDVTLFLPGFEFLQVPSYMPSSPFVYIYVLGYGN